jgi:Mitochondrial carrier protein
VERQPRLPVTVQVVPRKCCEISVDGQRVDNRGSRYFAAYEVTKKILTPASSSPADLNLGAVILAGGTAGVAMWALAIPPDVRCRLPCYHQIDLFSSQVLKSRIQSAPSGTYSGILDCARKTIAQDGLRALWKGFGPAMARVSSFHAFYVLDIQPIPKTSNSQAFPANAATFVRDFFFLVMHHLMHLISSLALRPLEI